jgi:hypothetical protein
VTTRPLLFVIHRPYVVRGQVQLHQSQQKQLLLLLLLLPNIALLWQ